jgi:hypothetical protein
MAAATRVVHRAAFAADGLVVIDLGHVMEYDARGKPRAPSGRVRHHLRRYRRLPGQQRECVRLARTVLSTAEYDFDGNGTVDRMTVITVAYVAITAAACGGV